MAYNMILYIYSEMITSLIYFSVTIFLVCDEYIWSLFSKHISSVQYSILLSRLFMPVL